MFRLLSMARQARPSRRPLWVVQLNVGSVESQAWSMKENPVTELSAKPAIKHCQTLIHSVSKVEGRRPSAIVSHPLDPVALSR